ADLYFIVAVYKNNAINTLSFVVGWIYFAAWALSYYPQIITNYMRKSVSGLNFDYLALNIVGFTLYSLFNLGLYFIPEVEDEYFQKYPGGLNPIQENDVFNTLHATLATSLLIAQCFLYETGGQKVSTTAKAILGIFAILLSSSLIISLINAMQWLNFLYFCSYIKLTITLIKYVPQALMNYRRKSTHGWSIGTVLLDFTGGVFSVLQMILNAYNY
ncbi:hypothetical protein ILUMI_26572, partial [Ignelater luminosus]